MSGQHFPDGGGRVHSGPREGCWLCDTPAAGVGSGEPTQPVVPFVLDAMAEAIAVTLGSDWAGAGPRSRAIWRDAAIAADQAMRRAMSECTVPSPPGAPSGTELPSDAVEAAAGAVAAALCRQEEMAEVKGDEKWYGWSTDDISNFVARCALASALPAIRRHIADELREWTRVEGKTDLNREWLAAITYVANYLARGGTDGD